VHREQHQQYHVESHGKREHHVSGSPSPSRDCVVRDHRHAHPADRRSCERYSRRQTVPRAELLDTMNEHGMMVASVTPIAMTTFAISNGKYEFARKDKRERCDSCPGHHHAPFRSDRRGLPPMAPLPQRREHRRCQSRKMCTSPSELLEQRRKETAPVLTPPPHTTNRTRNRLATIFDPARSCSVVESVRRSNPA
jgi:hypothetical protein